MQITVKSVSTLKTGENNYGPWKLVKVVTDKDEEYTTLAKEADTITKGSIITITNMDEDDKGKKSFKKFEVVSAGTAPASSGNGGDMTNEMWTEKQAVERTSIEGQVAMKCWTELVIAKIDKIPDLLQDAIKAKLGGFMGESKPIPKPKAKPSAKTESTKTELSPEPMPDNIYINMVDLQTILDDKKWKLITVETFLVNNYQIEKGGELPELIAKLDKEQQEHFMTELQSY